jgi:hypothetical protein
MTLSELRTEVRDVINRDTSAFSNDDVDTHINRALRIMANSYTFEDMRKTYSSATIADQKLYNYPTGLKDVYSLRLIDGASSRKITAMNQRRFDEQFPYPEQQATGRPYLYIDYGSYFQLHRVPDAAYTIHMRCSIFPPVLDSDTAEPLLTNLDTAIIALASGLCLMRVRELEDAEYWHGVYGRAMKNAVEGDHSAEDWTPVPEGFHGGSSRIGVGVYDNPLAGR